MRTVILFIGLVFLAQVSFAQQSGFALRGGVNAATFKQTPAFDYGTLVAGQGGFEIYFGKHSNPRGVSYL